MKISFFIFVVILVGLDSCGPSRTNKNFPNSVSISDTDSTWFAKDMDFSVSLWIKTSEQSEDTTIILSNADFRKKDMGIYGERRNKSGITLYCYQGGWGWNIGNDRLHYLYEPLAKDQPLADGKWHQLAFTYNSKVKEIRLYYDGINKCVISIGDLDDKDFASNKQMIIGGNENNYPYYRSFSGKIKKVKAWDATITTDQLRADYGRHYAHPNEPQMENEVLTIVNWNIWHGGTHFTKEKDGFDGIERVAQMLMEAKADIVLMQETYGAGSQISSDLGFYYYEAASTIGAVWGANLSVMSRYPIEETHMVEEQSNYGNNYAFNNGGARIRLSNDKSIIAFSNWYNGGKPEDLEGALTTWEGLIDNANEIPIVYAGDFNSVSHLDDGIGRSGHSMLMETFGFTDSYRTYHPDVEKYPGKTAPRFEDRIDFVYFKGKKLELINTEPIDPQFKGRSSNTPNYPSDHMGIITRFKIK